MLRRFLISDRAVRWTVRGLGLSAAILFLLVGGVAGLITVNAWWPAPPVDVFVSADAREASRKPVLSHFSAAWQLPLRPRRPPALRRVVPPQGAVPLAGRLTLIASTPNFQDPRSSTCVLLDREGNAQVLAWEGKELEGIGARVVSIRANSVLLAHAGREVLLALRTRSRPFAYLAERGGVAVKAFGSGKSIVRVPVYVFDYLRDPKAQVMVDGKAVDTPEALVQRFAATRSPTVTLTIRKGPLEFLVVVAKR